MPFRSSNGAMTSEEVALARSIFDDICAQLKVGPDAARRRDEVAHQVMLYLHEGDRSAETIKAKVLAALR